MSGNDWLAVIILIGFVILVVIVDRIRDLDRRAADHADRAASQDRLMGELEGKP